jgi:hypothetical protein
MNTATCQVSKKKFPITELYKGRLLRKELLNLIQKDHPDFNEESYISIENLNEYRKKIHAHFTQAGKC